MKKYGFGWIPQPEDTRDFKFSFVMDSELIAPRYCDLRENQPLIYNQGSLGSCTANGISAIYEYEMIKRGKEVFTPSRLHIYFMEREMEGSIDEDAGAIIRDGMKCINKFGVCPETEWPYIISKFRERPPVECWKHALEHQVIEYLGVRKDLHEIKVCLSLGFPIVFGFTVFTSFMDVGVRQSGYMTMPVPGDKAEGGHAVVFVGYNDDTRKFIVRNSWGTNWGAKGYFYMPYDYLQYCRDFWTIRLIE